MKYIVIRKMEVGQSTYCRIAFDRRFTPSILISISISPPSILLATSVIASDNCFSSLLSVPLLFFWARRDNHWNGDSNSRCAKRERKTVSDFRLKTPPAASIAPGVMSTISRLNGSRGPGRALARYRAPPALLTPAA